MFSCLTLALDPQELAHRIRAGKQQTASFFLQVAVSHRQQHSHRFHDTDDPRSTQDRVTMCRAAGHRPAVRDLWGNAGCLHSLAAANITAVRARAAYSIPLPRCRGKSP